MEIGIVSSRGVINPVKRIVIGSILDMFSEKKMRDFPAEENKYSDTREARQHWVSIRDLHVLNPEIFSPDPLHPESYMYYVIAMTKNGKKIIFWPIDMDAPGTHLVVSLEKNTIGTMTLSDEELRLTLPVPLDIYEKTRSCVDDLAVETIDADMHRMAKMSVIKGGRWDERVIFSWPAKRDGTCLK